MDFLLAAHEVGAEFVDVAQEGDVFLEEDCFAVGVALLEFFDYAVAVFLVSACRNCDVSITVLTV